MERLHFRFAGGRPPGRFAPARVGVVDSGRLAVTLETRAAGTDCAFAVATAARGPGALRKAMLRVCHERHGPAGVVFSIRDMGATPAVASLRRDRAAAPDAGGRP